MPVPRVSVIINCYNSERYLREAIDSVYAQTYGDWEIVLFDNASTDATATIAQSYDERLRYFRGETTVPLGAARNAAIGLVRTELIAFLDSDDVWLPERLARTVAALDSRPGCDFAYSNFFHLTSDGRESVALRGEQPSGHVFERFLERYPVGILTVLLRTRALDAVGGDALFDPALHISEEYDLFMRLLYSAEAVYVPEPLAKYRIHSDMSTERLSDKATAEFYHSLAKLRALDGARGGRFSAALDRANAVVEYARAKQHLADGELRLARSYIAPFKWSSAKATAVYLATFLPVPLWFALKPLWARGTFR